MNEEKHFIPDNVLEKVNEHTAGGFMIFYMRGDGEPDYASRIDNSVIGRGLISFARDILKTIRQTEKTEYILSPRDEEYDEEQGDQFSGD